MNSMEEDSLFQEWGWEKDLIGRKWISPHGFELLFDDLVSISMSGSEGELGLRFLIAQYGEKSKNDKR